MHKTRFLTVAALATLSAACLTQVGEAKHDGGTKVTGDAGPPGDPTANTANVDTLGTYNTASPEKGGYRDIASHPGCSTDGLDARAASSYVPAQIPGYKCAAKDYGGTEDMSKPIVVLVHGNSDTPAAYEKFTSPDAPAEAQQMKMLSERLVEAGFKTFAVDGRYDKVDDPSDKTTGNPAKNMDHGWYVPIVQHFLESVFAAYPNRKVSIVAHSLGPTVVRDALRRLHRTGKAPFSHIKDLVFASGAHHGVKSARDLCGVNTTMRGRVACELGDRTSYQLTDFAQPNNGVDGAFETPCADGSSAYGQSNVCGGNKVRYTTITMQDPKDGTFQDEFVNEGSAALKGANNLTVTLNDTDPTLYFYKGLFKSHFGSLRSENGLKQVMGVLTSN